jgi:hypothetical protein
MIISNNKILNCVKANYKNLTPKLFSEGNSPMLKLQQNSFRAIRRNFGSGPFKFAPIAERQGPMVTKKEKATQIDMNLLRAVYMGQEPKNFNEIKTIEAQGGLKGILSLSADNEDGIYWKLRQLIVHSHCLNRTQEIETLKDYITANHSSMKFSHVLE